MSLALVTASVERGLRKKSLVITITASGNYVAGGDTVNFNNLTAPVGMTDGLVGYPGVIDYYTVLNCPFGYQATLIPGTTLANWKLKIEQTGAAVNGPFAEISAAAYPAALLTPNTFQIEIAGPKLRI